MIEVEIDRRAWAEVLRRFEKTHITIFSAVMSGLEEAALRIVEEAQKLVPVDTGALRASARAGRVARNIVEASFGHGQLHYAIDVHERVDIPHRTGQARYLWEAIKGLSGRLPAIIMDAARRRAFR